MRLHIELKDILDRYKEQIDRLNIKKGSKESQAAFWLGGNEKLISRTVDGLTKAETVPYNLIDLKKDFPDDWQRISEYEKLNRQIYNDYIGKMNRMLEKIYPNIMANAKLGAASMRAKIKEIKSIIAEDAEKAKTPEEKKTVKQLRTTLKMMETKLANLEKDIASGDVLLNRRLIPRKDYVRHMVEMDVGFRGLVNILTSEQSIDPELVGVSEFTKPKTKWAGFLQRRQNGTNYIEDAVAAMVNYIQAAEYKLHIDPLITDFRGKTSAIIRATKKKGTANANNLIEWLIDFTNDLAGKTNPFDRKMQKLFDRKFMKGVEWVNNRVKANAVLFNLNSAIAQWLNLPNGIAYIKNPADMTKGAIDYYRMLTGDPVMRKIIEQSGFLTERYLDSTVRQFDESMIKKPEKAAIWLLEAGDKQAAQLIWFSAYEQGRGGREKPIRLLMRTILRGGRSAAGGSAKCLCC